MKKLLCAVGALLPALAFGQTTEVLEPSADTAIFSEGSLSNGVGVYLYVGNTAGSNSRRSLLAFDVSSIPAGATVTDATLTLNQSNIALGLNSTSLSLHRVNGSWGEGNSDAGDPGGMGAAAEAGDATWQFRVLGGAMWTTPGGDFNPTASSTTTVFDLSGPYDWTGLAADIQSWVDGAANDGWILIGDEGGTRTAVRFDSGENLNTNNRPQLTVTYTAPVGMPGPGIIASVPTLSAAGLLALIAALLAAAALVMRRRRI